MIRTIWLTGVVMVAVAQAASAANPKGVAAVLLPNWREADADRLVAAVADARAAEFEVAFWATYSGNRGYAIPQRVVSGLLARNIRVRVRVFLGTIHDTAANGNLGTQAAALNRALVAPYKNDARVAFRISPALEDEYPNQATWEGASKAVLRPLDTAAYPRLRMVRCTTLFLSDNRTRRTGGRISIPAAVNAGAGSVGCESESHSLPRSGSVAYSNDGQFVFVGREEFRNSSTAFAGTKTLGSFKADGGGVSGAQMLWRPSYNLHGSNGAAANRIFDGSKSLAQRLRDQKPAFDGYEASVLKTFLQ